jgi:hypothetical protein
MNTLSQDMDIPTLLFPDEDDTKAEISISHGEIATMVPNPYNAEGAQYTPEDVPGDGGGQSYVYLGVVFECSILGHRD